MPYGVRIITFPTKRQLFRGEVQNYHRSLPSLNRILKEDMDDKEKELNRVIAHLRKRQFGNLIWKINIVPYWEATLSDVNLDALAQHYGFATHLMDLTNDFKAALFFATCKYVPETEYVVKVLDRHVEKAKHNLKGSPIVVSGGYGVGSKEGFDQLFQLAEVLHAEVGASRAAVDAGWIDHDRQIGQTGVTVRPKLYIACGISGQIQHIAGMQESSMIISINSDPEAPINKIADYVITGTVEEVIPKMIKYYKKNSK